MSPFADPSTPIYARIVLAILVFALVAALVGASAVLVMGTHHPARTFVEMAVGMVLVGIGALWDRGGSGKRRLR